MDKDYKDILKLFALFLLSIAIIATLSECKAHRGEAALRTDQCPGDSELVAVFLGTRNLRSWNHVKDEDLFVKRTSTGMYVRVTTREKTGNKVHVFQGSNISVYQIKKGDA